MTAESLSGFERFRKLAHFAFVVYVLSVNLLLLVTGLYFFYFL